MGFSSLSLFSLLLLVRLSLQQSDNTRIDCYPEAAYANGAAIDQKCVQRNCIWQSSTVTNVPWCFFPQTDFGYTMTSSVKNSNGYTIYLRRLTRYNSPFPEPINDLRMDVVYLNNKIINFKIKDAYNSRYEVPLELNNIAESTINEANLEYEFNFGNRPTDAMFSFSIKRKSSNVVLFDTSMGGMVFNNQFLQLAIKLPSGSNLYGFGENNHPSLSHDMNHKSWGMFARDQATAWGQNTNQYGVQPFYSVLEEDGNSHGVMFLNSNAMDYSTMPLPALVLRSIGGIFDFNLFSGPSPEAVVQQFTSLVGRPVMIPYFALGFQLSRWNYKDLNDMKRVVERNIAAGIPLDVQYADIEHFKDNMDFTIDEVKFKGLPEYFRELQSRGMRTVIILDPALVISRGTTNYKPFVEGKTSDVFIKWPAGTSPDYAETSSDIMLGYCWPNDKVAYPDFMLNRTRTWWKKQILDYRAVNITFDGLWIDMNEPVVFDTNEVKPWNWPADKLPYWTLKCPTSKWDDPPYRTKAVFRHDETTRAQRLSQKTLCMVGQQGDGKYNHYDVHNLYGLSESIATLDAVRAATGKRSFVLTRSTFLGNGRYAGHWLGDNQATYTDMHRSIIGMIEFSMFGIPYTGADICGFFDNSDDEMCTRWQQIGAFYPFSRNHNADSSPDQDPAAYSQQSIDSTRRALLIRYTILPYYYTLFYKAHTNGTMVVKGLFQEFPKDKNCRTIDKQFLVGPAVLVTPVLAQGKTSVTGYFPTSCKWYSYHDGTTATGQTTLNAPINFINVHIRGGHIIPTQAPANTTFYSRKNPFGLIVALDDHLEAHGDMFYDDGDSIDTITNKNHFFARFEFKNGDLSMIIENNGGNVMTGMKLDTLRIFGLRNVERMSFDELKKAQEKSREVNQNRATQVVQVANIQLNENGEFLLNNLDLDMNRDIVIKFDLTSVQASISTTDNIDLNDDKLRIDCHPEAGASEVKCIQRGCSWVPSQIAGTPWCFFNKKRVGYKVRTTKEAPIQTRNRIKSTYELYKADSLTMYGNDVANIRVEVELKGSNMVRIKLTDANRQRYEVPVPTTWDEEPSDETSDVNKNDFDVRVENDQYGRFILEVYRISTGRRLFSTREYAEGFFYSDKYIQMYARLASESVYGWGENTHHNFKHRFSMDSPLYPLWARDEPPLGGAQNLYGVHPFYMAVEDDGNAHGLLIMNSNAQEYKFAPLKTLEYKTIGGILDIYMYSGPTPESVIRQHTTLIGKPFLPPYYALGFQLCRYGYNNLNNLKAAVDRTKAARIPLDIQYADIDHFDRNLDFTYDPVNFAGLPQYIDQLKTEGIKFIIILDPALNTEVPGYQPYIRGQQQDVWIKWPANNNPQYWESGNQNMLGYVWPEGKTVFPDFFLNRTIAWWSNEVKLFYNTIKFDGLWIDMNEPANFGTNKDKPFNWPQNKPDWSLKCPTNEWDDPPYRTNGAYGDRISDKTLCLIGEQSNGVKTFKHYDVHNLYGWSETIATFEAMKQTTPTRRPLVISRSTFPSSGKYAGHWLGDNESVWPQLKYNLIGLLEFNLFGIPYVGADICGFFGNADGELCLRWMQLGAFNPFFRNHNSIYNQDQDPGYYSASIADSIRKVVETRYTLLPFLYTLFYDVHINGGTVVRSLVHEFPTVRATHDIDEQFMWGSALLISPVLEQGKTTKYAYFPSTVRWYNYYNGVEQTDKGHYVVLSAPLDTIPLHVKGGHVIPTQESAMNTELQRKNPFSLVVAPDASGKARGSMYWDDGLSIDSYTGDKYNLYKFDFDRGTGLLQIRLEKINYNVFMTNTLKSVRIFDTLKRPFQVLIDGMTNHLSFTYDATTKVLELTNLNIPLNRYSYIKLV